MQTTTNFGLKKPEGNEFYDVNVQNDNLDVIDEKLKECMEGGTAEKVTYENESVADVTNVKEALDGILDGTQLEQWSATKYTGYTTEEVVSIYNNLHVNASDSMYYRARVEHRAPFSVLGSGDYYVEGFRLVDKYGTQEAIRYTGVYEGNVIMKFYRTLTDGVWSEWQRTFTDVGGTVGNGTSDSPFGIKGKDHAFMEFSNKDSYIFGRIGFNAGKELTMYDTDWVGYKILHEGNKPSGTYMGNGSATERVIDVGGFGNGVIIYGSNKTMSIVCNGAICRNETSLEALSADNVVIGNLTSNVSMTLRTSHVALNQNGVIYTYHLF